MEQYVGEILLGLIVLGFGLAIRNWINSAKESSEKSTKSLEKSIESLKLFTVGEDGTGGAVGSVKADLGADIETVRLSSKEAHDGIHNKLDNLSDGQTYLKVKVATIETSARHIDDDVKWLRDHLTKRD